MKRLKIFPKMFLYTFAVMLLIIAIAHISIYLFAPQMILSFNTMSVEGVEIENVQVSSSIVESAIIKALPFSLICCVLVSFACSLLFSKAITVPLEHISKTTGRMACLDKSARCNVSARDEIGILASNVNGLYADLLSSIESLEEEKQKVSAAERSKVDFLRAASHELKTPVTALKATLENMILGIGRYKDRDAFLPECLEMADQLSAMIKEVLDASRTDFTGLSTEEETFEMSDFIRTLCEPYSLIAKAKGIHFHVDAEGYNQLTLPKQAFGKIVSNVLSNAVAYTDPGKQVTVTLDGSSLVIENECVPVQEDMIESLFEPFYRPDFSRDRGGGGNGLGLFIVDKLAKALDLRYEFLPVSDPEGMAFSIYFKGGR